jgi:hypothetical protein
MLGGRPGIGFTARFVERSSPQTPPPLRLEGIEAAMPGDAEQPGAGGRAVAVSRKITKRLDEHPLANFFGLVIIAQHAPAMSVDGLPVRFHEQR